MISLPLAHRPLSSYDYPAISRNLSARAWFRLRLVWHHLAEKPAVYGWHYLILHCWLLVGLFVLALCVLDLAVFVSYQMAGVAWCPSTIEIGPDSSAAR